MSWQNEHSWRFLFPASECGTDRGEMETFTSPGSSWTAGLNFSPRIFQLPTYQSPGAWTMVGAGIKGDPLSIAYWGAGR